MAWRFPLDIVEIAVGTPTDLLGLNVRTVDVIHRSGAPSTAVRLSDGRRVLAYSGDTEWTDALFPISEGADLFIVECYEHSRLTTGHMTWSVLSARLPEFRAKRIMITHMSASMLAHVEEARSAGVLVAEDGMSLDVG